MSNSFGYKTKIWFEEPEADNPFAAKNCYCHGYDVYGDILSKATWFEYLFLLFKGEKPTAKQANLLETLAIALTNLGPREPSIRAAMNGGVGGATHAASLMSALSVGAGQCGGAHEVYILMSLWDTCGTDLELWLQKLPDPVEDKREDIWKPMEHAPGFDPNGVSCPTPVVQTLSALTKYDESGCLHFLQETRKPLEATTGIPLSMTGVSAAAFHALGFDAHAATMLYLMLRLPGAAAHAIEQRHLGWRAFPFYGEHIHLTNDPGKTELPNEEELGL
ncbi:citryl-CoA lyase [Hahella sp. CCB-MM4]|uniref:citryl-CoA lyase n=1 Tax=Hahella sp. (strain CCB-MM4) TaxID=1926491 RepID=UPI000B9A1B33|nr:citryl-CoA lyase [Hahella sp. CCB-MM4]OZG70314.1 citryl-CoA lyase [Hahella sp. CCB-MM4]